MKYSFLIKMWDGLREAEPDMALDAHAFQDPSFDLLRRH